MSDLRTCSVQNARVFLIERGLSEEAAKVIFEAGLDGNTLWQFEREDIQDLMPGPSKFCMRQKLWKIISGLKKEATNTAPTGEASLTGSELGCKIESLRTVHASPLEILQSDSPKSSILQSDSPKSSQKSTLSCLCPSQSSLTSLQPSTSSCPGPSVQSTSMLSCGSSIVCMTLKFPLCNDPEVLAALSLGKELNAENKNRLVRNQVSIMRAECSLLQPPREPTSQEVLQVAMELVSKYPTLRDDPTLNPSDPWESLLKQMKRRLSNVKPIMTRQGKVPHRSKSLRRSSTVPDVKNIEMKKAKIEDFEDSVSVDGSDTSSGYGDSISGEGANTTVADGAVTTNGPNRITSASDGDDNPDVQDDKAIKIGGNMPELPRIVVHDCVKYNFDEIRECKYCYHNSKGKQKDKNCEPCNDEIQECEDCYDNFIDKQKDWFCKPCRPPHELVYAKQRGFSFWPGKVIGITEEGYDVRFFGGRHQSAVIAKRNIKPIDTNLRQLTIKKNASFVKACEELRRHQQLLEHYSEALDNTTEAEVEEEEPAPKKTRLSSGTPKVKKMYKRGQDSNTEAISSSNFIQENPASTHDDTNLVTSSEDSVHTLCINSTAHIGTQTSKKSGKQPNKHTQTDSEFSPGNCVCDSKYKKIFCGLKTQLEKDHIKEKECALSEMAETLKKDFEVDKLQAVSRAMANIPRETELVQQQTEEQRREQYMEEITKLANKHEAEISAAKKKQWCYNCEEEAMYHCCWNASYCSIKCQQEHWHQEHKYICLRPR